MVAHGIGNNISFRHIEHVGLPKKTRAYIGAVVKRFAIKGFVVVTKFGTLVSVGDLLVNDVG
jgi:nitrate/nitrite transporter NarK